MATNTPLSTIDRLQLVLATTSKLLGTSAIPRDQLTALVVDALAPLMAGPEALQYLGGVLRSRESFATTSGGVVHVPSQMDSIGWTITVDAYDAMADLLRLDDQVTPIERWSHGIGRVAAGGQGGPEAVLGVVGAGRGRVGGEVVARFEEGEAGGKDW